MPPFSVCRALLAVAALLGTASIAQAATLTREPYLQSTDATSTVIAFRTDADCPSTVRFGPTGSETASEQPAGTQHVHSLTGLTPGAEYQYSVEACGEVLSTGKRFRTAPPVGTQTVHFAAVGDQGRGSSAQFEVGESIRAARPEFTLALGDNAYDAGTEAEHQTNLFEPLAALLSEVPYFATPGNHEYVTDNAAPYVSNFHLPTNNPSKSERYYSFDWGFVHVVSLDSMCGRGSETAECTRDGQLAWLEQDLASTSQPWKVIFFHHPPFSSGDHLSEESLRAEWGPIFEKHGVDLVLSGHDHNYERSHPMIGDRIAGADEKGITYLVVGSGGAELRPWPIDQPEWSAIRNNTDHGYLDVKISGGSLNAQMVSPTGKVIDQFSLTKDVPSAELQLQVVAERGSGPAPLDALLVASASPSNAEIQWDFGDGTTGSGPQVAHTYAEPGLYTATAQAKDPGTGQTTTGTVQVSVSGPDGSVPAVPVTEPNFDQPTGEEGPPLGCGAGGFVFAPVGILVALRVLRRRRSP